MLNNKEGGNKKLGEPPSGIFVRATYTGKIFAKKEEDRVHTCTSRILKKKKGGQREFFFRPSAAPATVNLLF